MSNIIQAHFVQSTELDYETLEMINFICMITDWTFNESNYFRCKMKERAEIMPDGSERIRSICVEMGYMPDYFQSCTSVYYDKTENQSKIKGE